MKIFHHHLSPRSDALAVQVVPGFEDCKDSDTLSALANFHMLDGVAGDKFRFTHDGHTFEGVVVTDDFYDEGVSIDLRHVAPQNFLEYA